MSQENPLQFVKRRLRESGSRTWPEIEKRTGKPISLIRKIAYGDRKNPRLDSLLPLMNYFERIDAKQKRVA